MTTHQDYPFTPMPFTDVSIDDRFWAPRIETNRTVTIPYDLQKCEETDRIANLERAAGWRDGLHQGIRFNDSDVFKVMEGAAYALHVHPDPALDDYLDNLIRIIAAAQEEDGYLFTARTIDPENVPERIGLTRWSELQWSHELYNLGHMFEAAVAHHLATGKRTFLEVALKAADLLDRTFGPDGIRDTSGHEEVELGLVKLYRVTGEQRYLDLATFFLDERGQGEHRELYGPYAQDHLPVGQQTKAVGHAVRAGYLYASMADVAALSDRPDYVAAMDRIWSNIVGARMYLTGGIGARHEGEAFGEDYELPNATAYNETCAAISMMLWNQRLFALHGDVKYVDILERTLYNGYLAGVSLGGDAFFYENPLESDGTAFNHGAAERQPWFDCSCCPTNVVRVMPSLGGYLYAQREDDIYVNLYAASQTTVRVGDVPVKLSQATDYPVDGRIRLTVEPDKPTAFTLRLRVPGWARKEPVPSDLYRYLPLADAPVPTLMLNGELVVAEMRGGYLTLRRTWQAGDTVELSLPMPVRRATSHPAVAENVGRVAVERGPLVYAAEWPDHAAPVHELALPDDAILTPTALSDELGGIVRIQGTGVSAVTGEPVALNLIPYYAWAHRGPGPMRVWLERRE